MISGSTDALGLLSRMEFRIPGKTRSRKRYYLEPVRNNYLEDDPLRRAFYIVNNR